MTCSTEDGVLISINYTILSSKQKAFSIRFQAGRIRILNVPIKDHAVVCNNITGSSSLVSPIKRSDAFPAAVKGIAAAFPNSRSLNIYLNNWNHFIFESIKKFYIIQG